METRHCLGAELLSTEPGSRQEETKEGWRDGFHYKRPFERNNRCSPTKESLRDDGGLGTPWERGWPRRGWWREVVICWALRNSLKHLISRNEGARDRFLSLDGRNDSGRVDGPGAAGRGYTVGLGLGMWGAARGRGRRRTSVAPRPGPRCTGQTSHQANTFFKAKKKPVCSGRGFLAVCWVPGGSRSEEVSVMAPLPKVTAI